MAESGRPAALEPSAPLPIAGDPLEDRIRFGMEGSIAHRTAIAIRLARILADWHAHQKYHQELHSRFVLIGPDDSVDLTGPSTDSKPSQAENIEAFGLILFQLLRGELLDGPLLPANIEELHKAGLPAKLVEVVDNCLHHSDRYAGFKTIVYHLEAVERIWREDGQPPRNLQVQIIWGLGGLAGLSALLWLFLR